jgi:hypothetical protein
MIEAPSQGHDLLRFDHLNRETSLTATVAGTADFLNSYSYDSLNRLTQVTQAQQTGGNSVTAKRVNFAFNADGQYTSIPGAPGLRRHDWHEPRRHEHVRVQRRRCYHQPLVRQRRNELRQLYLGL